MNRRRVGIRRAAWISTAMASSGFRWQAAISPASTGQKCKGPLNGPTATGRHCPEGWTLYPYPGPQFKGVTDYGQRRGQLLHLGRSVQHLRPRRQCPDLHRQRKRCIAGAGGWEVHRSARALPDGVLRQGFGRPHRRSERRVEGPRSLVDLWHTNAVPCRGWKGHDQQSCSFSTASNSAGAMTSPSCVPMKHAWTARHAYHPTRIERLTFDVNRGAWRHISVKRRCVTMPARAQEPCMVDVQLSVECRLR